MGWAHHFLPDETELAEHYPTRAEKAADGAVHAIGLLLAAIGGAALFIRTLTIGHAAAAGAAAAYAVCLVAMLTASAIYNLTRPSKARRVLRRLDEAAIFVMIAGSYTPFTITQFPDPWAFWITAAVWALAAVGAFGKLFVALSDLFWSLVYIGFGWLSVVIVLPMAQALTRSDFWPPAGSSTRAAWRSICSTRSGSAARSGTPSWLLGRRFISARSGRRRALQRSSAQAH